MDSKAKNMQEEDATDVALVELGSPLDESRQHDDDTPRAADSSAPDDAHSEGNVHLQFKLYRQRYTGMLGIIVLNVVAGMSLTWFGPIANNTSEAFGISLDEVNWLGNIVACTYILISPIVPLVCSRFGLRVSYAIGTGILILSAWVRFAGTAHSLSSQKAYALLIIGQFLSAIPQVVFQVLPPKFSETWFDLRGRTTATMLMSVSNPVGTALGQLISPMIGSVRASVLVLGIISTAVAPFTFLIGARPPTPPSYSGSQPSDHLLTTLRAIFGLLPTRSSYAAREDGPEVGLNMDNRVMETSEAEPTAEDRVSILGMHSPKEAAEMRTSGQKEGGMERKPSAGVDVDAYMTMRERVDFVILTAVFSVLVAGINVFSILSNEILEPYGYSDDTAGLMGAALLLSGLAAAFATSPLFDRVLTHHLGITARINIPIIAAAWFSLIWAARPHNTGALYAVFVIIGVFSLSMLPVALELGCELTRNSEASSAILWWGANVAAIVFTLVMSHLRASSSATPPLNMHRSLIYCGASICSCSAFIVLFRGRQRRRERDARIAATALPSQAHAKRGHGTDGSHSRQTRRIPLRIFKKSAKKNGHGTTDNATGS